MTGRYADEPAMLRAQVDALRVLLEIEREISDGLREQLAAREAHRVESCEADLADLPPCNIQAEIVLGPRLWTVEWHK